MVGNEASWEPGLCRFFWQGKCKKGASCTYSHDESKTQKKKKHDEEKREKPRPYAIKEVSHELHKRRSNVKWNREEKRAIQKHQNEVQEIENHKQGHFD